MAAAQLPSNEILEASGVYPQILGMTRNIRGHINRGKKDKVKQDILERQTKLLCGKHAINHLLQEEKVIWKPEIEETYIPNGNPMDDNVKINLADYCNTFYKIYKAEHNILDNATNPDCDLVNGNLTSDLIQVFLGNELRYQVDIFSFSGISRDEQFRKMRTALLNHNSLGAIINVGGYHWTALSQNLEVCRKRVKGRLESFRWAYLDSMAPNIFSCADLLSELLNMIESRIQQVIVVSFTPASYVSTAVERTIIRNKKGEPPLVDRGIYPVGLPVAFKNVLAQVTVPAHPPVTKNNNIATFHNNNNAGSVKTFNNVVKPVAATRKGGKRNNRSKRNRHNKSRRNSHIKP